MSFLDERDGIQLTIRDLQIGLNVILGADVGHRVGRRLTGIDAACVVGNGNGGRPSMRSAPRWTSSSSRRSTTNTSSTSTWTSVTSASTALTSTSPQGRTGAAPTAICACWDSASIKVIASAAVLCPALDGVFNVLERLVALIEPALTPVLTNLGEFIVNNLVPPTPLESDLQLQTGDLIADLSSLKRAKPLGIHAAAKGGAFQVNCDDRDLGGARTARASGWTSLWS